MRKTALRNLVIVGVAALVAGGVAGCRHHRARMDPERLAKVVEWKVDDALDELKATDAQRDQVHKLAKQILADGLALREGGSEARKEIALELLKDEPDAQKLHTLVDERIDAVRSFAHHSLDRIVENHGVLTPEQRAQLRGRVEEWFDRR